MDRDSRHRKIRAHARMAASFAVGGALVFAAVSKLADPTAMSPMLSSLIARPSLDVVRGIAVVEALLGLWLLSCAGAAVPLVVAMAAFGVFGTVHGVFAYYGESVDCGCLGRAASGALSNEAWAGVNGGAAVMCLICASGPRQLNASAGATS